MGDRDVGSGGERVDVLAHQARGVAPVGHVVQRAALHEHDRPGEVETACDLGVLQQLGGARHVGLDEVRVLVLLEQRLAVSTADGVDVDVHHARLGVVVLRHLVGVLGSGKAAAQVEELVDAHPVGEIADHSHQPAPVHPAHVALTRCGRPDSLPDLPVDVEVVLATEAGVIHTRDRRSGGIQCRRRQRSVPHAATPPR
jgi:hypothetical protein